MKFCISGVRLLCILALTQAGQATSVGLKYPTSQKITNSRHHHVKTKWINQKLDQFDEQSKTFRMRYLENDRHFKSNGPIFIYLGGEWPIHQSYIMHGIIPDLAKEHHGILFHTEHRFYGQSKPNHIKKKPLEKLKYLNAKQSLADLAHFIRTIRRTDYRLTTSKVIICGGSYGGSLAIWFRKLYPDLVDGVFASSAPLFPQLGNKEYYVVVGKALLELGSQQCYDRVKNGVAEVAAMFAGNRSTEAKQMLALCSDFNHKKDLDLWSMFLVIGYTIGVSVQYQRQNDIPEFCQTLMSAKDDLSAITTLFAKEKNQRKNCTDVSYNSILQNYKIATNNDYRWRYQYCNEFGWFATADSNQTILGSRIPITLYTTLCSDIFGTTYTKEHIQKLIDKTNSYFGGKSLYHHDEKIYMTYGSLDPWSPMGYAELHGATVIPGASHCADFDSISSADSPAMRASKERLKSLVRQWLA